MSLDKDSKEKAKNLHLINEEITVSPVMLVEEESGDNRVVEVGEALELAKQRSLDLVLINDRVSPPIVKILDYGKLMYEIKKKKKHTNRTHNKVKSVTVKPQIGEHDMGWKADKAIE